jgi:glycosyltransferase involved in cell wall biosynthesis
MQRSPRLAMLTLPGLDHFTGDLIANLPAASGWTVKKFFVTGPNALPEVLAWTNDPIHDALWFEFCWPPFPSLIGTVDFGGRRVIVRVHRIEATEAPYVAHTPWEKVDDLIVISPDMKQRVLTVAPEIAFVTRLHLILNGADTERFAPAANWDRHNIGWCGLLTLRKNPTLALLILAKLHAGDTRYRLNLCGMGGEPLAHETFTHLANRLDLRNAIHWHGNVAQAQMPTWHAANGVLLHTSLHEGLSYAVMEAAATGCDLAVFDHPGAAACWPAQTLFGTVDEAVDLIRAAKPARWRAHVVANFSLQQQIAGISAMLNADAFSNPAGGSPNVELI